MNKGLSITIGVALGSVILGSLLTASLSAYEPKIKRLLGVEPKLLWESNMVSAKNDGQDNLYLLTVYNKSDVNGDFVVSVPGTFTENDFQIEGARAKTLFENDSGNTYIKIDSISPEEDLRIILRTPEKIQYPGVAISSKTYQLEEKDTFPFDERNPDTFVSTLLTLFVTYLIIVAIGIAFFLGKRKKPLLAKEL